MGVRKKSYVITIYRMIIQIIFFILLPGLYASTFLGLKTLYLGILNGNLDAATILSSLVEVIAVIPVTILLGRFFCGWMCAFGAVSDWLYAFSKKVFKIKFKMPEIVDQILKYVKYIILLFLAIILWHVNWSFLKGTSPWDAFGYIFTIKDVPDISGAVTNVTVGTILLVLILGSSMFVERFFCRYMCPLGAVFTLTSRFRIFRIKKVRDKCGACKICTNNCPMGISLYKKDKISTGECIQCMKCTSVCPRNNAKLTVADENMNAIVAGTVAVAAITSVYYVGSAISGRSVNASSGYSSSVKGQYTDGTYEGSGTGFRGGTTTVSVTVSNGNITDVQVVSNGDDAPYFNKAKSSVISQIIDTQSSSVDAVSGATFSSNGIMSAVADALSNANGVASTSTSNTTNSSSNDTSSSTSNVANSTSQEEDTLETDTAVSADTANSSAVASTYADGTYEGSGTGFHGGTTTVSVTVSGGAISDIAVVSYEDDRPYFSRAFDPIVAEIVSSQSTNVDSVSGATFSSNGIMSAVDDALSNAVN